MMDIDRCFSVGPGCSGSPLISDWVIGVGFHHARKTGLCGWSDDRRAHSFHDAVVHLDPFSPFIVEPTRTGGEGGVREDGGDAVMDHLYGHNCAMDDREWVLFCREVLLLEEPIPQTMEAIVKMVDEMVMFIVRAVAGADEFSKRSDSRLMELVVVLTRFLLLCGGSGMFPYDYAAARFSGIHPFLAGGPIACGDGRLLALKLYRRLVSLGRCVRGLLRVAWDYGEWVEPALLGRLGLNGSAKYFLCDVWRAAVGKETPLAVFMQSVVGPSYFADDVPSDKYYVVHEYDSTTWRRDAEYTPMSSETMVGGVVYHLLAQGKLYADFGGVDRRLQVFLHNLHWGFMHQSKYMGMRGSARFPTDLLALFGIMVGRCVVGTRPLEFRLIRYRSWQLGDAHVCTARQNADLKFRFLSPLTYAPVYERCGGAVSEEIVDSICYGVASDCAIAAPLASVSAEEVG